MKSVVFWAKKTNKKKQLLKKKYTHTLNNTHIHTKFVRHNLDIRHKKLK